MQEKKISNALVTIRQRLSLSVQEDPSRRAGYARRRLTWWIQYDHVAAAARAHEESAVRISYKAL